MEKKPHFLYQFVPGERPELFKEPDAWTERDSEIASEHFSYLKSALEDGVLIFAGRSQDGIGPAVVVIEAQTETEARQFMMQDPFIRFGLFGAELHPFRAALVRVP